MKTKIYPTYVEFLNRENKEENGVSPEFGVENPDFEAQNVSNVGCWDCSLCSNCSSCSHCSSCSGCSNCYDCSSCSSCSNCSSCSHCFDCSHCSDCSRCSRCSDQFENGNIITDIPAIPNIHQTVYEAASQEESLDMGNWHHSCGTKHCRAGWVVHLAGEAGYELERFTNTAFAAMQIYKASSQIKVSPVMFYTTNEEALADMKRCANEEALGGSLNRRSIDMKLAQALIERKALKQKIATTQQRVVNNAVREVGTTQETDAASLFEANEKLRVEYANLIIRINNTNNSVTIESGETISEAIVKRDAAKDRLAALEQILSASLKRDNGFRGEDRVVYESAFKDRLSIRSEIDKAAKFYRELDILIQSANWSNDLI